MPLLGAGGVVRGAPLPFLVQKPAALVRANRMIEKPHPLGREATHGAVVGCGYQDTADRKLNVPLA